MEKPKQKTRPALYDWHEMVDYVEKKYKINVRDYAGKYKNALPGWEDTEYQDYWHFMLTIWDEVSNGGEESINFSNLLEMCEHEWQKEITRLFLAEFGDEDLVVWIEW